MPESQQGPDLTAIPAELKALPQWVLWNWEKVGDKWTKIPKRADGRGNADSAKPATWSRYEEVAGAERIGFVFSESDPYCGIDLDDCINPETGEISKIAQSIIDQFGSYAEISPSGTGVKLWTRARVPGIRRKHTERGIEMYHKSRFFTVTGQRVSDSSGINGGQDHADRLYEWLFGSERENSGPATETGSVDATDADILSRAFRAENSDKFMKLWNGNAGDYPSGSEADLALAGLLAFWTGPDPGRIERMFGESGLGSREKWTRRAGYRQATVARALRDKTEFFDWHASDGSTLRIDSHAKDEPTVEEKAESYEVPPFPVEAMPVETQKFIREAAVAIGAPADFLGLPVLAVLAQAVGASRTVRIKTSWTESSTLFCAIVAEPGTKKTPTAKAAAKPVWNRHFRLEREHRDAHKIYREKIRQHEADVKNAKQSGIAAPEEPKEPKPERVMTVDTTVEALISILADNPRGLMVQRDELTGWIRALDQYKGGKGSDKQHWLSLWSSAPITVDRKSQSQAVSVENPSVTLYGGIQPNMLTELGPTEEEGLIERFLFSYPEYRRQPFSWEEISQEASEEYEELYEAVARLRMASGEDEEGGYSEAPAVVEMRPEAQQLFARCADTIAWEIEEPGFPARLKGAYSKLEAYLGRISLILAVCRCAETGELERVETGDVEAAWKLVRYFGSHARKVYGGLGSATDDDLFASGLKDLVAEHGGEYIGTALDLRDDLNARDIEGVPEDERGIGKKVRKLEKRFKTLKVDATRKTLEGRVQRVLKISVKQNVQNVQNVQAERKNPEEALDDSLNMSDNGRTKRSSTREAHESASSDGLEHVEHVERFSEDIISDDGESEEY